MLFNRACNRIHNIINFSIYTQMDKKTRSVGLKAALFGDVPVAGGMAASLLQLARTMKGTASFNTEADTTQDFYCEEEPAVPAESVSTEAGLKQLKLNFMEWDNDTLIKVFGGTEGEEEEVTVGGKTYTVKKYQAPSEMVTVEQSVRVISLHNVVIDIPRAQITARFVWNLTRTDIAQIEVIAKILAPFGANDKPYYIYQLGEAKAGA